MVEQMIEKPLCKHHWIIESPQGTSSKGICNGCGDERMFRNSSDDHDWRGYRTLRPEVTQSDASQGAPARLNTPVFKRHTQLGGIRIA